MKKRVSWIVDGLALYLGMVALIWPLFRLKYLANWGSIEGTFVSQARFVMAHWPHPRWQPLWYCGTRFDYLYPPALQYGTAILASMFGMVPARAYHFYTALLYCAGIVGVYLLIRIGSGSRGAAWLGAAGAALVSPSFLFFTDIRIDAQSAHLLPQRLNSMVRYGEGPHITSFALLGIALALGFIGLRKGRPAALALCAVFSAWVVSTNFYGAAALAMLFPILVWSVGITTRKPGVLLRGGAIALLAYGLTAPWLVPSYLRITLRNMRFVSQPGNHWSIWFFLAVAVIFGLITARLAWGRRERAWPVFVAGTLAFMSLNVLGQYYFNFRVIGEPGRHVPELDLAIILAVVECLRFLWMRKRLLLRASAVAVALIGLFPAQDYVRHAYTLFPRDSEPQARVETRLTEWVATHIPDSRAFATGTVRFWYTAWHDIAQVGGASEQGVLNEMVTDPYYIITIDNDLSHATATLQATGTDAVIVNDKTSQEPYHDFQSPGKFAGLCPVLYDDHQGNVIYQVPRRFPGLAHVVESARVRSLRPIQANTYWEDLAKYVEAMEKGPDSRAWLRWDGSDRMRIRASLAPGQGILVQESYDPAWRAYASGQPLRIEKDVMNFMLITPPAGEQEVLVVFELPWENLIGYILFGITCAVLGFCALRAVRKTR